jgi:hypothetical protein
MKEDQLLKELLQNNLMEETSAGFTDGLMQRINIASSSASYTRSIWQDKFLKIIAAAFIFVSVLLLLMTLPLKKITLSFDWKLELPPALSLQLIQFLLVFWTVMLVNQLVVRRKPKAA